MGRLARAAPQRGFDARSGRGFRGDARAEAPVGYAAWSAFFDSSLLRVALFVFVLALAWHGFIGARDIVMDYIKVDWFRLLKHFGAFVYFVVCVAWAAKILL